MHFTNNNRYLHTVIFVSKQISSTPHCDFHRQSIITHRPLRLWPARLAVTEAMLLAALEGSSLVDCLTHGRLFTVDLGLLHALKDVNGHEVGHRSG